MSDPVTNIEIEDVLSSIRRLVSEDVRPSKTDKPAPQRDKQGDRLVLTPALRVEENIQPEDPEETPQDADPVLLVDPMPEPEVVQEALSQTTDADPARAQPEASEGAIEASEVSILSKLVEEELGRVLREPAQSEPDRADHMDASDTVAQEELEPDFVPEPEGVSEPEGLQPAPAEEVAEIHDADLEAKISALEELVASQNAEMALEEAQQAERDHPPADDLIEDAPALDEADTTSEPPVFQRSSQVMDWEDHSDDEATANGPGVAQIAEEAPLIVEAAVIAEVPQEETQPDEAETLALDEDMLREIVTQIVRQELQGPLGERITRNVRKLVRREIHRAFLNQEFE